MTAQEIRQSGECIKKSARPDGYWYEDRYEIWKVGEKYFEIHDRLGASTKCTMEVRGEVTELDPLQILKHLRDRTYPY